MTHFNRPHVSVYVAMMAAASLTCGAGPALAQGNASQIPHLRFEKAYPNEAYTGSYNRRRGNGAALAAGAVGLAAGAILGGALANQAHAQPTPPPAPGTVNPQVAAYCARTYRSYDPVSGTYLASNGLRYVCTYP